MKKPKLRKLSWKDIKRFDLVYVKAYEDEALGFVDLIDQQYDTSNACIIKTGFGRNSTFVIWQKDNPKIWKIEVDDA